MNPISSMRSNSVLLVGSLIVLLVLSGCKSDSGGGGTASNGGSGGGGCVQGSVVNTESPGTGDPLESGLWFINNTTQSAYAGSGGVAGQDINLSTNTGGSGVIVAVVDTGLEIGHEDLLGNIVADGSWNFVNSSTNPTNTGCSGDHGTSVGGLIAAEADNGLGGRGIAPQAQLVGFNFLSSSQSDSQWVDALGGAAYSDAASGLGVFNQSYGISTTEDLQSSTLMELQYLNGVTTHRGGKGAVYVKSSGNGFGGYSGWSCNTNITCENANFDPYNTLPYNLVVGAVNADGVRSSYSTAGSALWVSAPGGEYGYDTAAGWAAPPTNPANIFEPAMITTDQSGCSKGYSRSSIATGSPNLFEDGHSANADCNYTSTFNGTSSAAPVLSGVVALMLAANSALTWRDVKHILATTSTKVDPSGAGAYSPVIGGGAYTAEPGWITNFAGHEFSNWYGFGRVNAGAAVAAAPTGALGWGSLIESTWSSSSPGLTIPDNNNVGIADTNSVTGTGITFIEAVQIKVTINHSYTGDLSIELTSPSGTTSTLFTLYSGFAGSDHLSGMVLLSNAYYEEPANGSWTIRVVDGAPPDTGTLTNWQIRIYGH